MSDRTRYRTVYNCHLPKIFRGDLSYTGHFMDVGCSCAWVCVVSSDFFGCASVRCRPVAQCSKRHPDTMRTVQHSCVSKAVSALPMLMAKHLLPLSVCKAAFRRSGRPVAKENRVGDCPQAGLPVAQLDRRPLELPGLERPGFFSVRASRDLLLYLTIDD
jgi:hypothetical protein